MKGFGKFMSRTPHMVTSKVGMAKSMSSAPTPHRDGHGGMIVYRRVGGPRIRRLWAQVRGDGDCHRKATQGVEGIQ
jgi:hypothetical protein